MSATVRIRFLVGFLALAVAACGGGGGGGSASPDTVFTLSDPAFAQPGGSRTFNLTGTSNDGDRLTATLSLIRRPDTTFNGQAAQQIDTLVSISFVGGGTVAESTSSFNTPAGVFLGSINNNTQVQGFPVGPQTALPDTAKIGDFGFLGAIGYSDGATASSNCS